MSDPVERDVAGLRHGQDEQQPSNLPQDQEPAQVTHANPAVEDTPGDTLSQLRALVATLKKDGKSFQCICKDGVLRNLHFLPTPPDQPTEIAVYDAIPLSPEMLKAYLDRRVRWSQETEDRFRGVDGTSVPQEQWLHPPPGVIESRGTKIDRDRERNRFNEEQKLLYERIERGEISAEEAGVRTACGGGGVISNFDLRPR